MRTPPSTLPELPVANEPWRPATAGASLVGPALFGLLILLALPGAAPRAAAQAVDPVDAALAALLPAEPGRKACYMRAYDAAHLRAHPKQRITAITFLLRVFGYDAAGNFVAHKPDHMSYNFAMSVRRRGDKGLLRTSGDCHVEGGKTVECVVDCDGGGINVERLPKGDTLLIRLMEYGILMYSDCYKSGVWVKPGTDDKAFHVDKVPPEVCRPLEKWD